MKKVTFFSIALALMIAFVQCGDNGGGGSDGGGSEDNRIKDGDGNVYTAVAIRGQTWLKENLKTTKYNDGTAIANITDNTAWKNATSGAYCWYNNTAANKDVYGGLYNSHAVNTGKLCPKGWHVAMSQEWSTLINVCGADANAGGLLKEKGTAHWTVGAGADDSYGFTALPGGQRAPSGGFDGLNVSAAFWVYQTTTCIYMQASLNSVSKENLQMTSGASVRCIKDN